MSLRINQNVTSLSTYSNLSKTSGSLEKSIAKLSSGMRINSAADDAAGLAISEKMRSQISGLNRAKLNAQDGVSMIQAAEGGLNDNIQIGMMVEIPATAALASKFAKYADFFSIGTNDLIQYTMAADRMSEKVSYLYQPLNPSILTLIKMTIDGAHAEGKWCGMCGEMAGDAASAPVLLGLGLDEFSMSASSVLNARKIIRSLSYEKMKELANKAVNLETEDEVKNLVQEYLK